MYLYQDQNQQAVGPYSKEELRQLHLSGVVKPDTLVWLQGTEAKLRFQEWWASSRGQANAPADERSIVGVFTQQTSEDLRLLLPHLLMPLKALRDFDWLANRKLLSVAGIGLLPLIIYAAFAKAGDVRTAYWAIAFYFSVLWAMFFYYLFPTPQIRVPACVICFFGTGVISISLLLLATKMWPLKQIRQWTESSNLFPQLMGYFLGVGVPEETCKVLVLYYIWKTSPRLSPQAMMFYGLMAGLGFGIYEGVNYQTVWNYLYSRGYMDKYYLLNLLRLTTLPFLHAIWTGTAGYFIGFAGLYPQRRRGLLVVAIGLPALLHGLYDTFGTNFIGLGVALLSVLAVNLYLAKSVEFEKALNEQIQPGAP